MTKPSFSREEDILDMLQKEAFKVRENAYCPYSRFAVGAALRLTSGDIISGCNVENASFGATLCAERNAIAIAIAKHQHISIDKVFIVADSKTPCTPCGICRQTLIEHGDDRMQVICSNLAGDLLILQKEDLLPYAFSLTKKTST